MRGDRKHKMLDNLSKGTDDVYARQCYRDFSLETQATAVLVLNGAEIWVYLFMHCLNNSPLTKVLYILRTTYKDNQP